MNSTVHVLNMNVDTIPLDSTITVEDSEPEMIDLDSSPNSEITCLNNSAIYNSEKTEHLTKDDVDAINKMTIHSSSDMLSVRSNDETLRPAFKVMFRDERIASYVIIRPMLCLQRACTREILLGNFLLFDKNCSDMLDNT